MNEVEQSTAEKALQVTIRFNTLSSIEGFVSSPLRAHMGIEEDEEAMFQEPSINELFDAKDLARMVEEPEFLEVACNAIEHYTSDYYWDGNVKDARLAYTPCGHDFESAKLSFQQYWLKRKESKE